MNKFYQVAGLKPGSEIVDQVDSLSVNLSCALQRTFSCNDEDLSVTRNKGDYIWASGGGTYLFNHRYLPVVQRPDHAKVNPGKLSLFTGRADNTEELLHPTMLVRELFEELILFTGERLYIPDCVGCNKTIERVYTKLEKDLGLNLALTEPLYLEPLMCKPKMVSVTDHDFRWEGMLDCHVNSNGEVNILFLLAGDINIEKLLAVDGEYHLVDGRPVRDNRRIYLYDLHTAMGKDITLDRKISQSVPIPTKAMTEHLHYLVESIKQKLVISSATM